MFAVIRVFVVLLLVAGVAALLLRREAERHPNVILITVESLRTDHVGFQDGTRDTTPNLDLFADEAMVYTNAWSVTSWTLTSHASLFTGLYPSAHQTVAPLDKLGDSYETLAESFAAAGYQTAAVVSGPYLRRQHGLDQGFAQYDDEPSSVEDVEAHDDVTNPAMLEKLRRFLVAERDPDRPFFLFGYFWDPHYDYLPPAPYDRKFTAASAPADAPTLTHGFGTTDRVHADSPQAELDWVRAQYDGEIAWTDHTLRQLFDTLREEGLWEDTIVVITSDHGEEFFDHGKKGHKNNLFVESVHVPLIVKYAGSGPVGRDDRPASLVDLYPTLVDEAGFYPDVPLHGESLREPDPDPARALYFELLSTWYYPKPDGAVDVKRQEWLGVLRGGKHLVGVPGKRMFLFDLAEDPREQEDLFRHGERYEPLARSLDTRLRQHDAEMAATREFFDAGGAAEVDPEQLERLRSLGYIQ